MTYNTVDKIIICNLHLDERYAMSIFLVLFIIRFIISMLLMGKCQYLTTFSSSSVLLLFVVLY